MPTSCAWTPDDVLKAIAFGGAALAFVIGLAQYRRAQQWKRAEWVAQEMKALFDDPLVQAALLMIDWGTRKISLYPDQEDPEKRRILLTNEQIARALMLHSERPEGFSDLEADIRAAFDRVLDGLERFSAYVDTGLVTLGDLRPYLKYWAVNVSRERIIRLGKRHRLARLLEYMDNYGFDGALSLLERIATAERRAATNPSPKQRGPRLVVVCGLPGSGKTTLARALERELPAVRFCPDEWMLALDLDPYDEALRAKIEALQWEHCQQLLRLGQNAIIEWGTWGRSERDILRLGARALGAGAELHYLQAPLETLFRRISERGAEKPPIKWDDLVQWQGLFQAPTAEELALFDPPLLEADALGRGSK